eukprot:2931025-Amphidinium_carterae.1
MPAWRNLAGELIWRSSYWEPYFGCTPRSVTTTLLQGDRLSFSPASSHSSHGVDAPVQRSRTCGLIATETKSHMW